MDESILEPKLRIQTKKIKSRKRIKNNQKIKKLKIKFILFVSLF